MSGATERIIGAILSPFAVLALIVVVLGAIVLMGVMTAIGIRFDE